MHTIVPRYAVQQKGEENPDLFRAALSLARKGYPVFPLHDLAGGVCSCQDGAECESPGKHPRISRGFKAATTDPRKVTAWWTRWPAANVGIPTGERSGLLVIDVDPRHGGTASLEALEAKHGELPATKTTKTGSGGRHIMLKYPAGEKIGNSAGTKLGEGLDVRGEGGYIVAPPSRTTGPYEALDKRPPADSPAWLPKALRGPQKPESGDVGRRRGVMGASHSGTSSPASSGGPIPAGRRNAELFRLASSLRGRGHDQGAILEELEKANAKRCSPPLEGGELEKISASVTRYAPGSNSPETDAGTLEVLAEIEAGMWRHRWQRMGGHTDRDVLISLMKLAREHGREIPAGVRVQISYRDLALRAGVGLGSAHRAVRRLKLAGWLRCDNGGRHQDAGGAFVLVARKAEHSTTSGPLRKVDRVGVPPCAPLSAPRLRWSAPASTALVPR